MSAIHGEGIAAAWGSIRPNNSADSFGCATIVLNSNSLIVTLLHPMKSVDYCVVAGATGPTGDPDFATVSITSTTQFEIYPFTKTGVSLDPTTDDMRVHFVVYGR
jgi:hypothetical protein